MPRTARSTPGGYVYHVLNRAVARLPLFQKDGDYAAFERIVVQTFARHPMRLLAYCLMPNHWHMVLWPEHDGQLTAWLRWLTHTHAMRWHAHYHTAGTGHLYQGRFKSFPIEQDDHLYTVLRYVERNPLRANLVSRAEDWPWSSLAARLVAHYDLVPLLASWPMARPRRWTALVNEPQTEAEQDALRRALTRGSPFGTAAWQQVTAHQLGLEATLRPRGRPKKSREAKPPAS